MFITMASSCSGSLLPLCLPARPSATFAPCSLARLTGMLVASYFLHIVNFIYGASQSFRWQVPRAQLNAQAGSPRSRIA